MKKLSAYFIMILSFMLIGISDIKATDINSMTELQNSLTGATVNGSTIKLTKDVDLGSNILTLKSGTYIIDLNGFKITSSKTTIWVSGATLTIEDSSNTKKGTIETTYASGSEQEKAVYIDKGFLTINEGNFTSVKDQAIYVANQGNVTLNNGKFTSTKGDAIFMCGGILTVNGGEAISLAEGMNAINFKLYKDIPLSATINNVNSTATIPLKVSRNTENISYSNHTIKINGGVYNGTRGSIIYDEVIPNVKISGGTFTGNERGGIYIYKKKGTTTYSKTLKDLLAEGANYYPSTFSDKTNEDNTFSCTDKTVTIKKESNITIDSNMKNGTIKASKAKAFTSDEITLTAIPNEGYTLKEYIVTDKDGKNPVEVKDGKFKMPGYDVVVSANFVSDYSLFNESKNQTYTINKDQSLVFKFKASYDKFLDGGKVYIDDELIDSKNYTVSITGNAIISLSKEFMDTLEEGTYKIKFEFKDGVTISDTFKVTEGSNSEVIDAPYTGSVLSIFQILGGIALIGAGGYFIYREYKKRKLSN